jgi:hypothetical protein
MNNYITPPPISDGVPLDLKIAVDQDDNSIYLKITGFESFEDANEYAEYLGESLPLILFESDTKH